MCFEEDTAFTGNDVDIEGRLITEGKRFAKDFKGTSASDCQALCKTYINAMFFTYTKPNGRCFCKNSEAGKKKDKSTIGKTSGTTFC